MNPKQHTKVSKKNGSLTNSTYFGRGAFLPQIYLQFLDIASVAVIARKEFYSSFGWLVLKKQNVDHYFANIHDNFWTLYLEKYDDKHC